jgi:hypothetical protein
MERADPVFVRSARRYESYTDFWRLVELSGFRIVDKSQVDFGADLLYIWAEMDVDFMVPLHDHPKSGRRARTALWSIERPDQRASERTDARAWWRAGLDETFDLVDDLWVSDKGILAMDPRSTWACLGGHPGLREDASSGGRSYDVAHLGQHTPRREEVIRELERRRISVSPNGWGEERARILSSSKLLLGIERLGTVHISTPLRWAVAAAYRLPILQEEILDPAPLVPDESIMMAPIDKLADLVEVALRWDLSSMGAAARETFCERHTFRRGVEEAIERSVPLQKTTG